MKLVKELAEIEGTGLLHPRRRMVVLQRGDGNFTCVEQYHFISEHEGEVIAQGWASLSPEGIYATVDQAEAEASAALAQRYGP